MLQLLAGPVYHTFTGMVTVGVGGGQPHAVYSSNFGQMGVDGHLKNNENLSYDKINIAIVFAVL